MHSLNCTQFQFEDSVGSLLSRLFFDWAGVTINIIIWPDLRGTK